MTDEQTDTRAAYTGALAVRNGHIVQAIDVGRRYGEGDAAVDALRHVSVEFERDRFTAIVSLFGIANTLALSIYERTRELGLCGRSACRAARCAG